MQLVPLIIFKTTELLIHVSFFQVEYRAILVLNPDQANIHSNLGSLLRATGDLSGSEASYRRALALDPTHTKASEGLVAVTTTRNE